MKTFLALTGSLRKGSYNTALLRAWKELAPEGVTVDLFGVEDLRSFPPYDGDLEASAYPAIAQKLKDRIRAADGVIIATPEYNRSMPGMLKNVIDWVSRPYGDSAWNEKPVFVVGASGGPIGTAVGQYALKAALGYLNARVLGQPEFFVGLSGTKFTDDVLTDEDTKEHIRKAYAAFIAFVDSIKR